MSQVSHNIKLASNPTQPKLQENQKIPNQTVVLRKRDNGGIKHSARMLKRVARIPVQYRKEILKILKNQSEKRKARLRSNSSKASDRNITLNNSSNNSTSSVTKDWEILVALHGNNVAVTKDVHGLVWLLVSMS